MYADDILTYPISVISGNWYTEWLKKKWTLEAPCGTLVLPGGRNSYSFTAPKYWKLKNSSTIWCIL